MSADRRSVTAQVHRADRLPRALAAQWRALQLAEPAFANPLLGPDFAKAVGLCRDDARVAVFEQDGETVGFLPFHARPGGFARPIGAPFSDHHALVCAPQAGLRSSQALAAAGISAYRVAGLIDPFGTFTRDAVFKTEGGRDSYVIVLTDGAEAYLESLRAASAKRFKNMRRLEHKLAREVGPLRMVADDSAEAFDRVIAWKRAQFQRTGAHDVLGPDWSRRLMSSLFAQRQGDFRGLLLSLYAGDVHIAGHFGVRQADGFHPWLASTNPDYAAWSPGQTFLMQAIAAMPAHGLRTYWLGHGHDHYKRPFVREPFAAPEGLAAADSSGGRIAGLQEAAWALPRTHVRAVGRLQRRLDQIASVELSTGGRLRGVMTALSSRKGAAHAESVDG